MNQTAARAMLMVMSRMMLSTRAAAALAFQMKTRSKTRPKLPLLVRSISPSVSTVYTFTLKKW